MLLVKYLLFVQLLLVQTSVQLISGKTGRSCSSTYRKKITD